MNADMPANTGRETAEPSGPRKPGMRNTGTWALALGGVLLLTAAIWLGWSWAVQPRTAEAIEQLIAQEDWEAAEKYARKYRAAHPGDPDAVFLLARAVGGSENYIECARVLESMPQELPQRGEALFRAGFALSLAQQPREAERLWLACLDVEGDNIDLPEFQQQARIQLCGTYAMERRPADLWRQSWELYENALPRTDPRHQALAMRIRYEFVMVTPVASLVKLEPILELNPKDLYTRRAIGLYQLEIERVDEARTNLYQCVQQAPENVLMWEAWLECLDKTGDLFGMEQAVSRLPEAAVDSAVCWKFRGVIQERKGNMPQAIEAARRAVAIRPDEQEYCHRLGQLLMRAEQAEEAKQQIRRSEELTKMREELRAAFDEYTASWYAAAAQRSELAYRIGLARERMGRIEEAAAWYGVALSEQPSHTLSIQALRRIRSQGSRAP